MNCRELAELLLDYLGGDLTPEQREHIKDHLCNCPPCVAYVETYQITIQMTRSLPAAPLRPEFEQRLLQALKSLEQEPPAAQA